MPRILKGLVALTVLSSIVAAIVEAQDNSGDTMMLAASPQTPDVAKSPLLAKHLTSVGRSVASEYAAGTATLQSPLSPNGPMNVLATEPPPTLLAADTGALRSVVKRKTSDTKPTNPAPPATTKATTEPEEAEPTQPPTASIPSNSDKTSSRRTHRAAAPSGKVRSVTPSGIPSKPVSSRRVEQVGESSGGSAKSGALSSSAGALLRVDTIGPETIVLGEEARYVIRLANQSNTEAKQVQVRAAIPENVRLGSTETSDGTARAEQGGQGYRLLTWTVDRLGPLAERELALKLIPLTNRPFELAVEWSVSPIASSAHIKVQQPMLEIALSGPGEITYGDIRAYTVVLTNPGTGDAKSVSVYVSMGAAVADTLDVGTIPAGGSRKLDVEVAARQAGAMQIVATASGDNNLRAQASEQILVQRAELEIEAVGPQLKYTGSVGTYQVRVANVGDAQAKKVQAMVYLPAGVKYVRGIENATEGEDSVSWQLGELAPGTERTYRFYCELSAEGNALFRFAAREGSGLQAASDVTTQVEAVADLKLTVNDPKGPIPIGEETTYEIQITNRGSKAATQVQVVAQFSEGIEPVAAEGIRADIVPGQVIFQPILRIAPDETATLTIKAKAETDGNHVFRAEVKCADPETRLVAEDTTKFFGDDKLSFPRSPSIATPRNQSAPSPRIGSGNQGSPSPRIGTRPVWNDNSSEE